MTPTPMAVLVTVLVLAIWTDTTRRRIPNTLILTGLTLGWIALPLLQLALGQPWSWAPYLGALAGLAVLMPLYLVRGCAAGDVKLLAVVGAFVGPQLVLAAAVYTILAGGVLAALFMLRPGVARATFANLRFMLTDWGMKLSTRSGVRITPPARTAARLPYALAIAAGTLFSLWQQGLPT